eukprot:TRINITY_DN178_c0_g1_i1.p1 TRINITY_DN178_c0_g1~~TRINITY_DN178_c0_g1_i1.p1  ORF type:complete len:315 (-),score=24.55 TRINITY_DN178_c0_g1_i1:146-1090(-)
MFFVRGDASRGIVLLFFFNILVLLCFMIARPLIHHLIGISNNDNNEPNPTHFTRASKYKICSTPYRMLYNGHKSLSDPAFNDLYCIEDYHSDATLLPLYNITLSVSFESPCNLVYPYEASSQRYRDITWSMDDIFPATVIVRYNGNDDDVRTYTVTSPSDTVFIGPVTFNAWIDIGVHDPSSRPVVGFYWTPAWSSKGHLQILPDYRNPLDILAVIPRSFVEEARDDHLSAAVHHKVTYARVNGPFSDGNFTILYEEVLVQHSIQERVESRFRVSSAGNYAIWTRNLDSNCLSRIFQRRFFDTPQGLQQDFEDD